jgi:hypothetical protein
MVMIVGLVLFVNVVYTVVETDGRRTTASLGCGTIENIIHLLQRRTFYFQVFCFLFFEITPFLILDFALEPLTFRPEPLTFELSTLNLLPFQPPTTH